MEENTKLVVNIRTTFITVTNVNPQP